MLNRFNSNHTETPRKPRKIASKLSRLLTELLKGGTVNRMTLGRQGIAVTNDSLNSMVSILRNERLIPVESVRKKDGTCDYYMKPDEIARYTDPEQRDAQAIDMTEHVEKKREARLAKTFTNFITRYEKRPELWRFVPTLPETLDRIIKEIGALLDKRKSA